MKIKYKRVLATVTAAVMAWNLCNFAPALAGSVKEYVVDDVEDLPPEILYQTVGYGTEEKELDLPGQLRVLVREADPEVDGELETVPTASTATPSEADLPVATPSGADDAGNHTGDDGGDGGSTWREVRVNWTVNEALSEEPEYDGETPGTYLFEAEFQSGRYKLGEGVLPSIEVEVLPQEKTGITSWSYVDPEGYLVKTETGYELALPGASEENPAGTEDITALLPQEITAVIGGGRIATESNADSVETLALAGWSCEEYPEEGAYEGTYVFAAKLPEGYALAEGADALEVTVILGGGRMLENGSISYLDENGTRQEYKGDYTLVKSSTEPVTWNSGWYYVKGNVTIKGRITVNGNVNLFLDDSATLKAESGIEVNWFSLGSMSITKFNIYAHSSSSNTRGTLIATGKDGNPGIGRVGNCGEIKICGGDIQATGGKQAAGISSGNTGTVNGITITGGNVTAKGGEDGPGIGADPNYTASSAIKITGGTVNAEGSGTGAGISGTLSTTKPDGGKGDAIIYAAGNEALTDISGSEGWSGIIFQNGSGQVYGSQTLTEDFIVERGQTLTIPAGVTLLVPVGDLMYNYGTIINNGIIHVDKPKSFYNDGSIEGDGNILAGVYYLDSEQGNRTQTCIVLINNSTVLSEGWYCVGSNMKIDSRINVSGTVHLILGNRTTFTASKGIQVGNGNTLNIYAQTTGNNMGALVAAGKGESQSGIGSGGTVVINGGSVTANGGNESAGIGGTVTIRGGHVIAKGGAYGAGIGGDYGKACGTISISGGIVEAYGSNGGAGIGGGAARTGLTVDSGGTITISGGHVTARASKSALFNRGGAGIGGGYKGAGGTITISGGYVEVQNNNAEEGIGGGINGKSGTFSTGENGNAVIRITGQNTIRDKTGIDNWSGIIFEGGNGKVYGRQELTEDLVMEAGQTLDIGKDASLTVESERTLIIDRNDSLTGEGTLVGNGSFLINTPTEDLIVMPEFVYTGSALNTDGITLTEKVMILGKEFSLDGTDPQWTKRFSRNGETVTEVKDAGEYTVTFANGEKSVSKVFTVAAAGLKGMVRTYLKGDSLVRTNFTYGDTIEVKTIFTGLDVPSGSKSRAAYPAITEKQGAIYAVINGVEVQLTEPQTLTDGKELDFEVNTVEAGLKAGTYYTLIAKYMTGDSNIEDAVLYSDPITILPCPHNNRDNGICTHCGNYGTPAQVNGVYQIGNTGQLYWFAALVSGDDADGRAEGITAADSDADAELTADIPVCEKMIGNTSTPYAGTFNGNGHTVTVDLPASGNDTGLFSAIQNATIQNLCTAGRITTAGQFAGGVVGRIKAGESRIERCISSVEIQSTMDGDGTHGGIVGVGDANGTMLLEDCAFVGKIIGTSTTNCGGIVGWVRENSNSSIKNCWTAAEFQLKSGETGSANIARNADSIIKNCYYQTGLYGTQGIQKTEEEFNSGEVSWLLNGKESQGDSPVWRQTLGEDTYPVLEESHGIVYYGYDGSCINGKYSNEPLSAGKQHSFDQNGFCSRCGAYEPAKVSDTGYQIGNTGQLYWFAALVNGGDAEGHAEGITEAERDADAILTADIPDCEKMIGSESAPYAGTFNGNGYTVTVNLNASGDNAALFSAIQNATIQNLYTDGTIITGEKFASGVVGKIMDGESRIERCISSVEIKSTRYGDGTHGGIVGVGDANGTMLLEDCAFVGKIIGTSTTSCGGIVGWVEEKSNSSIKNCWTAAEFQLRSGETGSANIARNAADDIIKNCYYQNALYGTQGTQKTAEEFASGEVAPALRTGKRSAVSPSSFCPQT